MALRPLRNATISFGLVSIPVRFYTATKSEDIHFNLLHQSCGTRVNRKWWCPHHEEIVSADELVRGYALTKNKYVTFSDEEIEALETGDNRALEITEFVSLAEIDPVFFEKAYFLGPGTMFYADEVRDFGAIDIEAAPVREKEVALAEMLIDELTEKKFNPVAFKDDYRAHLLERIKAKSKGKAIVAEEKEEEPGGEVIDIMEALRRSLDKGKSSSRSSRARHSPKPVPARRKSRSTAAHSRKRGAS